MTVKSIPWRVEKADDYWIGICDPLKLTIESGTLDELSEDIIEAVDAVFQSLRETSDLDRVLVESGLIAEPGLITGSEMHLTLDIPFIPSAILNEDRAPTVGH